MSSISGVGAAALWGTTKTASTSSTAASDFSKMVNNLSKGKPANASDDADSSDGTVTITKVLSDGSVLITVMKGSEIISETKTRSASPQKNPTPVDNSNATGLAASQSAVLDKFNDTSTSMTAGSLFSADI